MPGRPGRRALAFLLAAGIVAICLLSVAQQYQYQYQPGLSARSVDLPLPTTGINVSQLDNTRVELSRRVSTFQSGRSVEEEALEKGREFYKRLNQLQLGRAYRQQTAVDEVVVSVLREELWRSNPPFNPLSGALVSMGALERNKEGQIGARYTYDPENSSIATQDGQQGSQGGHRGGLQSAKGAARESRGVFHAVLLPRRSIISSNFAMLPEDQVGLWSEMAFLAYTKAAREAKETGIGVRALEYILWAPNSRNIPTSVIADSLAKKQQGRRFPPRTPGKTIVMNDEAAIAILGTPAGTEVVELLLRHGEQLGVNAIESITVSDDWRDPSNTQTDGRPALRFDLFHAPAHDDPALDPPTGPPAGPPTPGKKGLSSIPEGQE